MRLVFVAVVVVANMALQTVATGMRRRSPRLVAEVKSSLRSTSSSAAFAAGVSVAWG